MNENVYQHFKSDEHDVIDKLESQITKAQIDYQPVLTDFLNPREIYISQSLLGKDEPVKMSSFGGYQDADLKRVLFYPDYFKCEKEDFELALLEIKYPKKFATLHHGQILGSIMGSGIKRNVVGDIITDGSNWQIIVEHKICSFLQEQVNQIGKINVHLEPINLNAMLTPLCSWEEQNILVSSLRIDNLIANCYRISRMRAKELINNNKVQVNWGSIDHPDYLVNKYDIISVRGFGRIRLNNVLGETRKQKLKVCVSIIKK